MGSKASLESHLNSYIKVCTLFSVDEFQKKFFGCWKLLSYLLYASISEIFKRLKFHDDCLSYKNIFSLPSYALKKPSWNFNFLHIFNIAASNGHENGCQMSARVFVVLFDTIDLSWDCMKYHVASFGNWSSIFRMKVVCNLLKKIKHTLIEKKCKKISERNKRSMKINI